MVKNIIFDLGNVLLSWKPGEFFDYFDGGIISAEVHCSKPDIIIYRILLDRYKLLPEECFYIDDMDINVKAAESAGIKAYCYNCSPGYANDLTGLMNQIFAAV